MKNLEELQHEIEQLRSKLRVKDEIIAQNKIQITQLSQSETALEQAIRERQKIDAAVNHLPVMLAAVDYSGNLVVWNKQCEIITGYSKKSVLGSQQYLYLLLGDAKTFPQKQDTIFDWNITIQDKKGATKIINWQFLSEESPVQGWAYWAIGCDYTEKNNLENQLRKKQKILQQQNIDIQSRNEELNSQNEEIRAILEELERNQNSLLEMNTQLELSRYRYQYFVDHINIGVWFGRLNKQTNLKDLDIKEQTEVMLNNYIRENANNSLIQMYEYQGLNEYLEAEFNVLEILKYPEIEQVDSENYILKGLVTKEKNHRNQTKYFASNILSIHQVHYPNQIWGTQRDITEQILAEKKIRESEKIFASMFELSPDGIMLVEYETGKILNVNAAFIRYSGYQKQEIVNKTTKQLNLWTSTDDRDVLMDILVADGHFFNIEKILVNRRREKYTFLISSVVIDIEPDKYILSIFKDVSDRKILEQQYLQSVIQTEEKERKRFAEDLHDDLGPLLSTVKLYVNSLKSQKYTDEQKVTVVNNVNEVIDEAIKNAKSISYNLMPNVLSDFGLESAIRSFLDMVLLPKNINKKYNFDLKGYKLEKSMELALFKITKELVNNTIKHAQAQNIFLMLEKTDQKIIFVYKDDGIGFEPQSVWADDSKGMGLRNIYSRAKSFDAEVFINTAHQKGFEVQIITQL